MDEQNMLTTRLEAMKKLIKIRPKQAELGPMQKQFAYKNVMNFVRRRMSQLSDPMQVDGLARLIEKSTVLSDDEKIELFFELDEIEEKLFRAKDISQNKAAAEIATKYLNDLSSDKKEVAVFEPAQLSMADCSVIPDSPTIRKASISTEAATFGWDYFSRRIASCKTLQDAFDTRKNIQASVLLSEEQKCNLIFKLDNIADELMK